MSPLIDAPRLWWLPETIGHRGDVSVLEGRCNAWLEAGLPIEEDDRLTTALHYPPPPSCHPALAMDVGDLPRPLVYPGSFSDWSPSDLPFVQGPRPE